MTIAVLAWAAIALGAVTLYLHPMSSIFVHEADNPSFYKIREDVVDSDIKYIIRARSTGWALIAAGAATIVRIYV